MFAQKIISVYHRKKIDSQISADFFLNTNVLRDIPYRIKNKKKVNFIYNDFFLNEIIFSSKEFQFIKERKFNPFTYNKTKHCDSYTCHKKEQILNDDLFKWTSHI